jgi:hypothetical protein
VINDYKPTSSNATAFPSANDQTMGLTKREYMATHIYVGFLARGKSCSAEDAVRAADRLIDALNGKKYE